MTEEELNIKIKVRPLEEQRDYLLEQNLLLTGNIATLEKENTELKERVDNLYNSDCWASVQLTNAKELILRLYNAGRDVLMCRAEEKAYDNLSNAINDKSIEQFLGEVGK